MNPFVRQTNIIRYLTSSQAMYITMTTKSTVYIFLLQDIHTF